MAGRISADAAERRAEQARIAAQKQEAARLASQSSSGNRISPDAAEAAIRTAGNVAAATANVNQPGGGRGTTSAKAWNDMSPAEQLAALNRVDWNSPFFQQGSKKSITTPASTTTTPGTSTTTTTTTPTTTVDTGGGGGGAVATPVSNVDQTSKLYAKALEELMRQYGVSQENILASIGRMREDPYNVANAYAQMRLADPRVAANPVAEYMAAAGMAPGQAAASQQMAQAEADAYLRAMQNVQNVLSTSQQQANASRMADIGLIETGATQDLESNLNMLRLGLERERIGAVTGLQQRNLENQLTMRNAISKQISDIFSGQNVAPESILKLIEAALAKMNTSQWSTIPGMGG